jgi:hypothetical protein
MTEYDISRRVVEHSPEYARVYRLVSDNLTVVVRVGNSLDYWKIKDMLSAENDARKKGAKGRVEFELREELKGKALDDFLMAVNDFKKLPKKNNHKK